MFLLLLHKSKVVLFIFMGFKYDILKYISNINKKFY